MCSRCEPTFDGYVWWEWGSAAAFFYRAELLDSEALNLSNLINGPLDLNIPYV